MEIQKDDRTPPTAALDDDNRDSRDVLIVGAGLSGLALALGLANLGCFQKIHILEKRSNFDNQGATFGLKPNGIKALTELCGGSKDKAAATELLNSIRAVGVPMFGGYMLTWATVRDALLRKAMNNKTIQIHMSCTILDMDNGEDCVAVRYEQRQEDSACGETKTISGCFLIGCDGVHSQIRDMMGLEPSLFCGTSTWRGRFHVPEHASQHVKDLLLKETAVPVGMPNYGPTTFGIFNFHSKLPNTFTVSANTKDEVSESRGYRPWPYFEPYIPQDHEHYQLLRDVLDWVQPESDLEHVWELRTVHPSTWKAQGRVTIMADAAHACRPASGVGGSLAFEDCVVLCREIQKLLSADMLFPSSYTTVKNMLQDFIDARLARVSKIWQDEWDRSESAYTGQSLPPRRQESLDWIHEGV